ncbi:protein RETARDED ROOT GROWTH-LIKE [Alnus glutinosa]|uniref:protein RETARDED ROOT GROWTH-LIKE n=1 Tax=Alnus glutinosa TaxID=3517 RepID=UPI002D769200|nr:protein RETARDED ROOT GROWTH-LIKE [Alnus glutinosa]
MWRTVDVHLRALRFFPSPQPSFTIRPVRTILTPKAHTLIAPQTLSLRTIVTTSVFSIFKGLGTRGSGSNFGLTVVRCVSSVSPAPTLEWNEPVSCSEVGNGDSGSVEEDSKSSIPVRAYFFSTSVDLRSLVEQNKPNFIPPASRMTNYVLLKFGKLSETNGLGNSLSGSNCCYMVVFQYGSIVLFNVREHDVDGYLKIVEKHASGSLPEMRKDEYEVREKPALSTWMEGGLDYIMLQYLNIDGIRTIGSVLGQSIALDYYVRQVDGMVAEFTDINREMETTGKFKMQRKKLFQLVGKANSNLADVILKLGLFERSDIAWKDAKYAQIWEYLRDEFELTQRFASLDFKLKFVEHNIRFLQEILQNRKSDFLEWLIIALIGAEILLSVYDIVHRSAIKL